MAKQKVSGSGRGVDWVGDISENSISQLRDGARRHYAVVREYRWIDEKCPCCMKRCDIGWSSGGHGAVHVSAWYYNEKKMLIFYWLCRDCSSRLRYGGFLNEKKMSEAIEENTLNAWKRDNVLN